MRRNEFRILIIKHTITVTAMRTGWKLDHIFQRNIRCRTVSKAKSKTEEYELLRPCRFRDLERLELTQLTRRENARSGVSLLIELSASAEMIADENTLSLEFKNVRKLKIVQSDWSVNAIPAFRD